MFHELHELEKISIHIHHDGNDPSRFNGWLVGEEIVSSLVQQNPNLSHIRFHGINFISSCFCIASSAAAPVAHHFGTFLHVEGSQHSSGSNDD